MEEYIHVGPTENDFISQIYGVFQSVASISLDRVKSKGEDDFGERISDEIWESSIDIMHTMSIVVLSNIDSNQALGFWHRGCLLWTNTLADLFIYLQPLWRSDRIKTHHSDWQWKMLIAASSRPLWRIKIAHVNVQNFQSQRFKIGYDYSVDKKIFFWPDLHGLHLKILRGG